jgi:exopolysaccharide production protein ExoQ
MSANCEAVVSRQTIEQNNSTMSYIVGFFLSFRLFFVLLAVRMFRQDPQVGVGAQLALNYLLLGIVIFQSFGSSGPSIGSVLRLPGIRWVSIYLGFSGASLFWTATYSVSAAIAFWVAMVADTVLVFLLLREGPLDQVTNAIMKGYVWGSCVIATIAWIMPSQSDLRLGDEELLGPNQIGYLCAFAFFFAQTLMRREAPRWKVPALLLGVTLLRSLSKTTILAFMLAQAFILLRDSAVSRATKRRAVLLSVVLLLVFSGLLSNYYVVYSNAGNQSETLTGRLDIWLYMLNESFQQPWIGHGFHSVWKVIPPFGPDRFEARHAHNELLQQFYAYGLCGVAILVGTYVTLFKNLKSLRITPEKTLFQGMLLFALVRGCADTEVFDLTLPMWSMVIFAFTINKLRKERASA